MQASSIFTHIELQADEYTYTTLIKTYSYSGQTDEALDVERDMAAAGFDVTDTIWGSLITACGQAGQLQSALRSALFLYTCIHSCSMATQVHC